jgi:RNA polymerase sigma factor for flagellar operon FliA
MFREQRETEHLYHEISMPAAARMNTHSDFAARNDLVELHTGLVHFLARRLHRTLADGAELDELVSAGMVGLLAAAESFDVERGLAFSTLATMRVRGAMLDQIRKLMNDTRTARKKRALYATVVERLAQATGTQPTRAEIARAMQVSDAELLEIEGSGITLSSISDEYDDASTAFASDDPDPFEALCEAEDRERLVRAMTELPDRLQLVLQLFFVEEMNLTEIAQVIDVSVPRVHQLRAKALADLRAAMEAEQLS